ncbi:MAG: PHP domain-containing protein [Lachnospiraceae bacterium]|nr:PHP domain-containing protein [Lachnospiraceae bacterium]
MRAVDLHVHSLKSDGSLTPSELVDKALSLNLRAFALTDHDCTDGLPEAMEYAKDKDVEVIPGIELSTGYNGKDVHIVGLDIDYKNESLQKWLTDFRASRDLRNQKMCDKLQSEAGIDISYETLKATDPGAVITRSHYAKFLFAHGYVKSIREAFDRYIGDHARYYVPREKIDPREAVKVILLSGGIPILAHPVLYHLTKKQLSELVSMLKEAGLIGIEAIYSTYAPSDEREIKALAKEYDLAISGGSDYHGVVKPGLEMGTGYGKLFVPEDVLDNLRLKKKQTENE